MIRARCIPSILRRIRRRWIFLSVALAITLSFAYNVEVLQQQQQQQNQPPTTSNVEYDDEIKAHFYRPSKFREHPDIEFEAKLDAGLRAVEHKALEKEDVYIEADDVIWQITLGDVVEDKSPESVALEERNADEWTYKVCVLREFTTCTALNLYLHIYTARYNSMGKILCQ